MTRLLVAICLAIVYNIVIFPALGVPWYAWLLIDLTILVLLKGMIERLASKSKKYPIIVYAEDDSGSVSQQAEEAGLNPDSESSNLSGATHEK